MCDDVRALALFVDELLSYLMLRQTSCFQIGCEGFAGVFGKERAAYSNRAPVMLGLQQEPLSNVTTTVVPLEEQEPQVRCSRPKEVLWCGPHLWDLWGLLLCALLVCILCYSCSK